MEIYTQVGDRKFKGFNKIPESPDAFEKAKQRFEGFIMPPSEVSEKVLKARSRQDALSKLSLEMTRWMVEVGMFETCLNCDHWNDRDEICTKFKMRPPAKIIVCGCEFHESDIPF